VVTYGWRALIERMRSFLLLHTRQAAATAAATLLVGSALIGLSDAQAPAPASGEDALSPIAQAIEMVSRRNMADLTSRTMTAQLVEEQAAAEPATAIEASAQSNVGLVLNWDPSVAETTPGAVLSLRRGAGDAPPQTPAEGVEVTLDAAAGSVRDAGLQPDTTYSYTLFIQRPGEKPEVLARVVATTSRFPTELLPGRSLALGDRLTSPSNSHYVAVADDGAVVLFNNLNQKLWSLDADPDPAASLALDADGALTVSVGEAPVWTAEATAPGAKLILTDEGALELLAADGSVVWTSEDAGYQLRGGDSPYTVSPDGWSQPGAAPVVSPYGMRIHPIYGVAKLHAGIDMTSGRGRPIFAAHDGLVTRVYQDSGGNWTIEIDHGNTVMTRYLHMDGLGGIWSKRATRSSPASRSPGPGLPANRLGRTSTSRSWSGPPPPTRSPS
jgi:murein DD-endopeptidase MepM/ murein hydrolase activator NlpD